MPLTPGSRLGPYDILVLLGAGGMGEVYRAKDTKLGREVALKILPATFTNDPDRVARFRREAQVLASLNHPHIAQIYGLEESNATQFLVLELVDGESLDKRIARGRIPVDEALGIANQIAEALEAAHEKGIIHRDLKPANIALTKDGNVKVLDFGLAKVVETTASQSNLSMSPTITTPAMMTGIGVILGTAAYMSPEQAKGFPADHRSDIFSFGVVLHEMLIGRPPFQGETVAEILASVLMREPDLSALPPDLNPRLAELLLRCLAKHPKKRWQAVGDLGAELQAISAAPHAVPPVSLRPRPLWRRAFPILASVFVGSVLTGVVVWLLKPSPVTPHLVRFTVTPSGVLPLPTGGRGAASPYRDLVLSPDGKRVIYNVGTMGAGDNDPQLWVRAFDQLDGAQLPGIVGHATGFPFMSPDGQWIAFYWGGELRKVSIFGGPPILLCRVPGTGFRGGSWGPDNRIIFASNDAATGLFSVPATGGNATVLTRPDRDHGEQGHLFPWVLPDGRAVLFTIVQSDGSMETAVIAALDLRTSQRKVLVRGGTAAQYVDGGYLVYASAGSLRAVRFNPARLEVLSDPVLVVDSVLTKPNGAAEF